jgi:outer membrane protein assembly factor BamB
VDPLSGAVEGEIPLSSPPNLYPAVADLNEDGLLDYLFPLLNGSVVALAGRKIVWEQKIGHAVRRSPACLDVTGDGVREIVVTSLNQFGYCLDGRSGQVLWKVPLSNQAATTPAIIEEDLVFAAWGGLAQRVKGETGEILWSYQPKGEGYTINFHASPTVLDLDGDGKMEVLLGDWRDTPRNPIPQGGAIHCLDGTTGNPIWVSVLSAPFGISPTQVDSGRLLVGDMRGGIFLLDGKDGSVIWQEQLTGPFLNPPHRPPSGLAEDSVWVWPDPGTGEIWVLKPAQKEIRRFPIDAARLHVMWARPRDAWLEISNDPKTVYAVRPQDGKEIWRWEAKGLMLATPRLIRVEGEGSKILVTVRSGLVSCLRTVDGALLWSVETGMEIEASPEIVDLDGDGEEEVVLVSQEGRILVLRGTGRPWRSEWPTFMGDRYRTGAPPFAGP